MSAPLYEVTVRKLVGSPHSAHTLKVRGKVVRSQLSPYGKAELEALVREYLDPVAVPSRLDDVAKFLEADKRTLARSARGGKNKSPRVTDRGFIWKGEDE